MKLDQPLSTIYYPYYERQNWCYWYRLSNGDYITRNFVTVGDCLRMYEHCKFHGIEFRAMPRSEYSFWHSCCSLRVLLNLFFKRLSDRSPENEENKIN